MRNVAEGSARPRRDSPIRTWVEVSALGHPVTRKVAGGFRIPGGPSSQIPLGLGLGGNRDLSSGISSSEVGKRVPYTWLSFLEASNSVYVSAKGFSALFPRLLPASQYTDPLRMEIQN